LLFFFLKIKKKKRRLYESEDQNDRLRAMAQTQKARFIELESNLADQEKEFDELDKRVKALNLDKVALETVSSELQAKLVADTAKFSSVIQELRGELEKERLQSEDAVETLHQTIEELRASVAQQGRSIEKQATKRKAAEGAKEGVFVCEVFVFDFCSENENSLAAENFRVGICSWRCG
jgi:uncharacterized coiled-coil protein SlyX